MTVTHAAPFRTNDEPADLGVTLHTSDGTEVETNLRMIGQAAKIITDARKARELGINVNQKLDMEPDAEYGAPIAPRFIDAGTGERLPYLPAPDLEAIAQRLIADYPEFRHLQERTVSYLWKAEGGLDSGAAKLGACTKTANLVKHFAQSTYVIWLAADHLNAQHFTRRQTEALLHHELLHTCEDEKGRAVVVGHDFEDFRLSIVRYGAWRPALEGNRDAWQQAGMEL